MAETHEHISQVLLLVGGTVVLAVFVRVFLERWHVPTLLGYILLGWLLHLGDVRWGFLRETGRDILAFLGQIGIFCLLFRVGLESKLGGLLRELRRASVVWLVNVVCSGTVGYVAARWALELEHVPSLFVAVALTATSVGMSIREWNERGLLQTRDGRLLVDVVELDDLSAVLLLGMLIMAAPFLRHQAGELVLPLVLRIAGWQLFKLMLFGGLCLLFANYVERHITAFLVRTSKAPRLLLFVLGSGFVLTAFGGLLGFSVVIGAFFAGLAFSREPEAVAIDVAFSEVYDLFVPFLYIGIGLHLGGVAVAPTLGVAGVLFAAAVLGKVIGGILPALATTNPRAAVLIGVSLVPRAAIALLIMQQGHVLGEWAVPDRVFSAMALMCAATWFTAPFALSGLFARWPEAVPTEGQLALWEPKAVDLSDDAEPVPGVLEPQLNADEVA